MTLNRYIICNYFVLKQFESTLCPPYQRYFYAYENSLMYSEELKTDIDFIAFIQVHISLKII